MLWFTIFIFNQREINYGWQTDRASEVREVSDWHCHSSQHLPAGGHCSWPWDARHVGHTPPPFRNTLPGFFFLFLPFNNKPLFFAGIPHTPGWASSHTVVVIVKQKFAVKQKPFIFLISAACALLLEHVCGNEQLCEGKTSLSLKQINKKRMVPLWFSCC